ncbi:Sec1-like protein [Meredithblackwellia eburnea MCA 4105]
MPGTSFLDLLKAQYLETLNSVNARWKILVVDEHTHKMLFSLFTTYDVLDTGIQQIDIITNQRSQQSHLPAIYILTPTSQNVDLVLRDYNPAPPAQQQGRSSKKSKDQPQPGPVVEKPKYAQAHLHFIDGIDDRLVGRLTGGLPDNYLAALKELYINFHAVEPRTFSLKNPQTFRTLYAPPERNAKEAVEVWQDEIAWMSRVIVNVLATLGEYPLIRYYNPPSSFHAPLGPASSTGEHIGRALALRVQSEIDAYARDNSDFPPEPNPPRPRGVLFITDRSMDLFAPFLHEFTYQAMVNDLLEIEDGRVYKYSFRNNEGQLEEKEAILSNDDPVWNEVKHMHMKDAMDKLIADFKAYAGEHGSRFGAQGSTSLNDMRDMLAALPQMREAKENLSLHLTMAEKCMGLFEKKKLPLSAGVEQCCATGLTPEGKAPKTLVEEMVPLLDDRSVSPTDKLRIIATYIMHRDGVPEGDKKRLYQHARLALHEMDAVDNLQYLGVNVSKDSGKKRKPLFKQKEEPDAYDISRYQPTIKYMLEEHFAGRLDQAVFPYVKDAPVQAKDAKGGAPQSTASLRSLRADWATKGRKTQNEPRQRVIVFVAGGATYSEVRSIYKVSEATNKDIFLGATAIVTPEQFVKELSNLDRGGGPTLSLQHQAQSKSSSSKQSSSAATSPQFSQSSMDRRFGSMSSASGAAPSPPAHSPPVGYNGRSQPPPSSSSSSRQYQQQQQGGYDHRSSIASQASYSSQQQQQQYNNHYQQSPPPPQHQLQPQQQQQQQYSRPSSQMSNHSYNPAVGQDDKNSKLKKKLFSGKLGF